MRSSFLQKLQVGGAVAHFHQGVVVLGQGVHEQAESLAHGYTFCTRAVDH